MRRGLGEPWAALDFLVLVQSPMHRAGHLRQRDVALAEALVERIGVCEPEVAEDFRQRRGPHAQPVQFALEHLPALFAVLVLVLLAKPAADLGATARRRQEAKLWQQPVAARVRLLGGNDLDGVAVRQLEVERHHAAVDPRAAAAMPQVGVHLVGEIERRRALGQVDDLALGAQGKHPVLEHFGLQAGQQVGLGAIALRRLEQLAQPDHLLLEAGLDLAALLVLPVRRDAEFGVLVHLAGADLHFERQLARPDDRRVQRAVIVALRRRDVVVELARECSSRGRARCRARRSTRRWCRP